MTLFSRPGPKQYKNGFRKPIALRELAIVRKCDYSRGAGALVLPRLT